MGRADRERLRPVSVTYLAGWLFADLLLVLFVTTFAATTLAPPPPKAAAHAGRAPTRAHQPPVLILRPHKFVLTVPSASILNSDGTSAADRSLASSLERMLQEQGFGNVRAGLVQAFGSSLTSQGDGIPVAQAANRAITRNLPLFGKAVTESYWSFGPEGSVSFTVFFFAHS